MKVFMLILSCYLSGFQYVCAQEITPEKLGFRSYTIEDKQLGKINYYISAKSIDQNKPVLFYLDGSGPYPIFQYTERGIGSSVVLDFRALAEDYHLILISKPGVPFIDSVRTDPEMGYPVYPEPEEYISRLSLDWRVQSAKLILSDLKSHLQYDQGRVAALGISEGFQVGAKWASIDRRLTHLLLFVGNGLNQFYDFIIQNRIDAKAGIIPDSVAQVNIDSLNAVFNDIYRNPDAIDKTWYGHTYLRWSSFTNNNPTENIVSLDIPVYIAVGSLDKNTTALSTDYLYLECLRLNKTNVTYKVYPYDHFFNEPVKDTEGRIVSMNSHMNEVFNEGLNWLSRGGQ